MRNLMGNILYSDPERKSAINSFLLSALSSISKVIALFPWVFLKVFGNVSIPTFASDGPGGPDLSNVDDGRYEYGLSQPTGYGVKYEKNIEIPMRDGTKLCCDIFRPDSPGSFPVIMAEAPYPRHLRIHVGVDDNGGVGTKHWYFEQANPEYWVPRGYVYISLSTRGYGGSEGLAAAIDYQEFIDYFDAIEWAAEQSWSNGKIGLFGISYYAVSQYWVAGLHPPHLKAIVPWEGLADPYRDIGFRGGIPCMFGVAFAMMMQFTADNLFSVTNYFRTMFGHPLIDDIWKYGALSSSRPNQSTPSVLEILSEIEVPMLSVGGLNDPDLHLRGNVYAFRVAHSLHKRLLLYSGTHWGSAYQPWANRTVLRFFDHWLKGYKTGIDREPVVDVQLRTGPGTFTHVYGDSWPLPQTQWTNYYLDARDHSMSTQEPREESSATAQMKTDPEVGSSDQITFLTGPLERDTAVAGPLCAHLWLSSSTRDIDLTVEVRDFDENGYETRFAYAIAGSRDEPVTRGWMRASLRALDPERTLPHQPFHLYTRNDWLTPGVPVPVDIEILPTGMLFKAGHRIALTVHCGPYKRKGEVYFKLNLPFVPPKGLRAPAYRSFSPDSGTTMVYTGGEHSSWLELPVIPTDPDPTHRVTIHDGDFTPALISGQMGDRFEWSNSGKDYHSVTESSGLGLWDSQLLRGMRSHNPETWWTKITWAGTFDYRDEVCGFVGSIAIPDRVPQTVAADSSADIELGLAHPPDGTGFDVQLKASDRTWSTVHEGTRDTRIATGQLAPGSYAVRSRLRRLDGTGPATESGWSPPAEFLVEA